MKHFFVLFKIRVINAQKYSLQIWFSIISLTVKLLHYCGYLKCLLHCSFAQRYSKLIHVDAIFESIISSAGIITDCLELVCVSLGILGDLNLELGMAHVVKRNNFPFKSILQ